MNVMQTVEVPENHRLTIEVPHEVPTGKTILIFTPASNVKLSGNNPRTAMEALRMAVERADAPNRKPISRHFGTRKGILGGNGVAYQRAIRDEWD